MTNLRGFFDIFGEYPPEAVEFLLDAERKIDANPEAAALMAKHLERYESTDSLKMDELNADMNRAAGLTGLTWYAAIFILYAKMSFHMRKLYEKKGISDDIWYNSVRDLSFKNRECHDINGEWGLHTDWFQGFLNLRLFALGRLHFIAEPFRVWEEPVTRQGITLIPHKTIAIAIHIPSDGKLLYDDVIASLKKAYDFYPEHRVDGKLVFQCGSWILYPRMLEFMTPGSNLSRFIECFDMLGSDESDEFRDCWRLFGRDYSEGSKALPRGTTLQRQYAEWLDKGNHPGYGRGIIVFDGEKILK